MSVGFIPFLLHAASALWSVLGPAVRTLLRCFIPLGDPVAESGADTSREGSEFPWFVLGITRFCGCRSLTKERLRGGWIARVAGAGATPLGLVCGRFLTK